MTIRTPITFCTPWNFVPWQIVSRHLVHPNIWYTLKSGPLPFGTPRHFVLLPTVFIEVGHQKRSHIWPHIFIHPPKKIPSTQPHPCLWLSLVIPSLVCRNLSGCKMHHRGSRPKKQTKSLLSGWGMELSDRWSIIKTFWRKEVWNGKFFYEKRSFQWHHFRTLVSV